MTAPDTLPPAPPKEQLLLALRRGDLPGAEKVLCTWSGGASADDLRSLAEMLMRRRQWAQAAWLFSRLGPEARDVASAMKQRLSVNLAMLQRHRPAVYEAVTAPASQQAQFFVAATASGHPTVHCRRADGIVISLSAGADPVATSAATVGALYGRTKAGEGIALCGAADGYLALHLSANPPKLFMDRQQPIFLIEPEPQILLQCLMIHDYTGPSGPIEAARFHWFVGSGWGACLEATLVGDRLLPVPSVTVAQGYHAPEIQERVRAVTQQIVDLDVPLAAQVNRYYDRLDAGDFAAAFKGEASRPPRVLLLTTRFSTVLQYSTRDTAAAFERLGWDVRLMIEPTTHHRVLRRAILAELAEFRPDLVFQIDHLRHEHQGLFPETLPFACWIQDHLPHLASQEVGRQIGELDFILTDAIATYVDKFAYPARQCVPLPKLVVPVEPAAPGDGRVDDIVFVSNASRTPDVMIAEGLGRYGTNEQTRELVTRCCRKIAGTYERGESLPTYYDVCGLFRLTLDEMSLSLDAAGFDVLARWLTHPFNDALYRQQALRWAAAAAREHGLTLGLYGAGWEMNPEFGGFARGPIAYGGPLRQLTRRSRINLQIVPYLCLHQRLLDGLMAGGFFLVRTHPADLAPAALLKFVNEYAGGARTTLEAVAAAGPANQAALQELVRRARPCLCTTGAEDVVAMTRSWEEAGQLTERDGPLPMLSEVGFHDAPGLALHVHRFANSSTLRDSVAADQRRSVGGRLSYDAGIRRVVRRMGELLTETAARQAAGRARGLAA